MAINESTIQLRDLGVDLEQEDDAAGFFGVMLERDPETSLLEMKHQKSNRVPYYLFIVLIHLLICTMGLLIHF